MDNHADSSSGKYEVSRYLLINPAKLDVDPRWFESDPFAVLEFWYERRNQFTSVYKTALRVFATPVSSTASESIFSLFKKLVPVDRASLSE